MTDKLPALDEIPSSKAFAQHLIALPGAGKAYKKSESNEIVRRALYTKLREAEQIFEIREAVFYRREGKDRRLGPARSVL